MKFEVDMSDAKARTAMTQVAVDKALDAIMGRFATQVQDNARNGAPWTDRTSNARNGLIAEPFSDSKTKGIILAHSVDYGIFLETSRGGKYRIIMPTLEAALPLVLQAAQKVLGSV